MICVLPPLLSRMNTAAMNLRAATVCQSKMFLSRLTSYGTSLVLLMLFSFVPRTISITNMRVLPS
jgi:hypothetical protein